MLLLTITLAASAAIDVPPQQTDAQIELWAKQNDAARTASAAATPAVLDLFSSAEFREGLRQCCASLADLPSTELLARFREQVAVAELAHNFPSQAGGQHFTDETLDAMSEYPWFINQWQAKLLQPHAQAWHFDPLRGSRTARDVAFSMSDAEVGIFGCAPFAVPDLPTWDEASSRLVYVAHNLRQRDTGSSNHFGDVSAIFRRSSVDSLVLIAPVDTGIWEGSCNASTGENPWKDLNCSYWPSRTVGTFEHYDHLIRGNTGSWSGGGVSGPAHSLANQTARLFARTALADGGYGALPSLLSEELEQYWESNIVGNPRLEAIKFLVPTFGALFGTGVGRKLQQTAMEHKWPLVWALGDGSAGGHGPSSNSTPAQSWPANLRLLDPAVGDSLTNFTAATGAASAFDTLWDEAAAARAKFPQNTTVSVEVVEGWWQQLTSAGLTRMAPLGARACADVDTCIGTVLGNDDCVCLQA